MRGRIHYLHYKPADRERVPVLVSFFIRWHIWRGGMSHLQDIGKFAVKVFLTTLADDRQGRHVPRRHVVEIAVGAIA